MPRGKAGRPRRAGDAFLLQIGKHFEGRQAA